MRFVKSEACRAFRLSCRRRICFACLFTPPPPPCKSALAFIVVSGARNAFSEMHVARATRTEANGHAVFYVKKKLLFDYATTSIDASNFGRVCLESVDCSFRVIEVRWHNVHVSYTSVYYEHARVWPKLSGRFWTGAPRVDALARDSLLINPKPPRRVNFVIGNIFTVDEPSAVIKISPLIVALKDHSHRLIKPRFDFIVNESWTVNKAGINANDDFTSHLTRGDYYHRTMLRLMRALVADEKFVSNVSTYYILYVVVNLCRELFVPKL